MQRRQHSRRARLDFDARTQKVAADQDICPARRSEGQGLRHRLFFRLALVRGYRLAGQRSGDVRLLVAVEKREEAIILALGKGIVLVIVTLSAAERHAEESAGRR